MEEEEEVDGQEYSNQTKTIMHMLNVTIGIIFFNYASLLRIDLICIYMMKINTTWKYLILLYSFAGNQVWNWEGSVFLAYYSIHLYLGLLYNYTNNWSNTSHHLLLCNSLIALSFVLL